MKAINADDVLKILHKYGKYIFVTDEKRYSSMIDEIANLKALEQKPCEDVISRQEAILQIQKYGVGCFDAEDFSPEQCERFVISKLNSLPPVNSILDKIRAEIDERAKINQNLNTDRARALCWCLDIIDKYKAESEK